MGTNDAKQFLPPYMPKLTKMKGKWRVFNKKFIDKAVFTCYSKTIVDGVCQFTRGEPLYTAWELYIIREERFL